jgi:hypothetical protein
LCGRRHEGLQLICIPLDRRDGGTGLTALGCPNIKRLAWRVFLTAISAVAYPYMRITERWTPYVNVGDFRLLACTSCSTDGIEETRRALSAFMEQNPGAAGALARRLRYITTVSGYSWGYRYLPSLRTLRLNVAFLQGQPLDHHVAMFQRLAITGQP